MKINEDGMLDKLWEQKRKLLTEISNLRSEMLYILKLGPEVSSKFKPQLEEKQLMEKEKRAQMKEIDVSISMYQNRRSGYPSRPKIDCSHITPIWNVSSNVNYGEWNW